MFKIGDFSKLCRVPVSALRYYADIELLEPAQIDRFTGYRYYSLDQLPRLNRILALKDLGLSLQEIRRMLDEDIPSSEIRGMLKLRQAEIHQLVEEEQARLRRVAARLKIIEQEGKMPDQEVVLKKIEPQQVLAVREVIPVPDRVGTLLGESYAAISREGVAPMGPPVAIFHDAEFKPENLDVEIALPVAGNVRDIPLDHDRKLVVCELAGIETAACIIHKGLYENLTETYNAIGRWIEVSGYRINGPSREIYLSPPGENAMTEIQYPVEKA